MNNTTILTRLGAAVKKQRLLQSISQEELAFQCGITRNQVSLIERGLVNIKYITFIKLSSILPLDLDNLIVKPEELNELKSK